MGGVNAARRTGHRRADADALVRAARARAAADARDPRGLSFISDATPGNLGPGPAAVRRRASVFSVSGRAGSRDGVAGRRAAGGARVERRARARGAGGSDVSRLHPAARMVLSRALPTAQIFSRQTR